MKIKVTPFAERHFKKSFGGTKILNMSVEEFENSIPTIFQESTSHKFLSSSFVNVMDGYAPFCKLAAIRNFTDACVGSMPITLENYQYIRSGYSARRDSELPVFSRWLELPVKKPKAEYLVLVLYNRDQIISEGLVDKEHNVKALYDTAVSNGCTDTFDAWKEANGWTEEEMNTFKFDADWGIVAILGQSHPDEEPMKPETMIRNALGKEEGGSGVPLNREAYLKSVEFWDKNATVK
jgi:hypothetical protein